MPSDNQFLDSFRPLGQGKEGKGMTGERDGIKKKKNALGTVAAGLGWLAS